MTFSIRTLLICAFLAAGWMMLLRYEPAGAVFLLIVVAVCQLLHAAEDAFDRGSSHSTDDRWRRRLAIACWVLAVGSLAVTLAFRQ